MRAYFGWSRDSDMPSRYIHLAQRDLEARVRAESTIDPIGAAIRDDPRRALADAVAQAVAMTAPAAVAETLRQMRAAAAVKEAPRQLPAPLDV